MDSIPNTDPTVCASAWTRLGRSTVLPAEPVRDRGERRLLHWEVLLVLSIFPLPSVVSALYALLSPRIGDFEQTSSGTVAGTMDLRTGLTRAAMSAGLLAAPMLVLYLLQRSGESRRVIGLDGATWRTDLALVMPVWFGVQVVPLGIGGAFVHWMQLPTYLPASRLDDGLLLGLLAALVAGVVEEIVVVGYLVRRLEQWGWRPTTIVIVGTALRLSYHLYYGPGTFRFIPWAVVSVIFYRRTRRLWPLIICHVFYDAHLAVGSISPTVGGEMLSVFVVSGLVLFGLWRNWRPSGGQAPILGASPNASRV